VPCSFLSSLSRRRSVRLLFDDQFPLRPRLAFPCNDEPSRNSLLRSLFRFPRLSCLCPFALLLLSTSSLFYLSNLCTLANPPPPSQPKCIMSCAPCRVLSATQRFAPPLASTECVCAFAFYTLSLLSNLLITQIILSTSLAARFPTGVRIAPLLRYRLLSFPPSEKLCFL